MHADATLIPTLVAGFVLAFVLGMLALRLKLSPLVGYLLAGVVVGPFTPGWVADGGLASQLSELGVILLMFGVGLHFSPADLLKVRKVAVPAALAQVAGLTAAGWAVGRAFGLADAEAALTGFCLSLASTVVVLRTLEERRLVKSELGRVAIGWLVVEDLIVVLALVLLPLVAKSGAAGGGGNIWLDAGWAVLRVTAFVGFMLVVGSRALPWLLVRIAHTKSRELFTLGVLAIALGIAWLASAVFGASFALGAFVAGLVLNASPLGHSAAERSLPLRDAFAVIFFVSVGMLFDPRTLLERPAAVAALVGVVIFGGSVLAWALARLGRVPASDARLLGASFGQIGEFSFVLAGVGVATKLMSRDTHDLVLAAALISIALNPFVLRAADALGRRTRPPAVDRLAREGTAADARG